MNAHTPGPWHHNAIGSVETERGAHAVWANKVFICSTNDAPGRAPIADDAAQDANCRLIAAAPDLLSIVKRWVALDGGAWDVERFANERARLLEEARAAIARAEGRT